MSETLLKLSSNIRTNKQYLYANINFRYGIIVMLVIVLTIIFWSLFRGIIMMDEAYYLLHFDTEIEPIALSNWYVIFKPFYLENLVQLRIMMFSLKILSAFFLGYAFSKFWGLGWPDWFTGFLIILGDFVLSIPVQFVPNNSSLNLILIHLGMGCLFMFYALTEKIKLGYLFLFISGVFFGFLPLAMITNSPLLFVMVVFTFFIGEKALRFRRVGIYAGGMILAILIFFLLLQNVSTFIAEFKKALEFQQFMESHGLQPLFNWHINLVLKFFGIPFCLIVAYYFWKKEGSNSFISKILLLIMLFLLIYQLFLDLTSSKGIFSTLLFYTFTLLMFLESGLALNKIGWKRSFLVLLMLIPYFAALGTDVEFEVRSAFYSSYIILVIMCLWDGFKAFYLKYAFIFLMGFVILNFFTYPFRKGWAGYRMVKQHNEVILPKNKGRLFLDDGMVLNLNKVRPHLEGKKNVVLSDVTTWGFLYLCDAKPLHIGFWANEPYTKYLINKKNIEFKQLNFLENKNSPFSGNLLKEIENSGFEIIDMGYFRLYTLDH